MPPLRVTRHPASRRLRVHRETLRVLGAPALAHVAGGTVEVDATGWDDAQPKTNGWSRGDEYLANVNANALCR